MASLSADGVVTAFDVVEFAESPRAFHARDLPEQPTPQIWWNRLTSPALVLGSTQRDESIVDAAACAAASADVVRRRSGGGAVLLVPGEVVWFDVIVPTGAMPALGDDVHAPMLWLGRHVADVLQGSTDRELTVKGPGMVTTEWSSLLCFDGVGPGEVLLGGDKFVGISQRRTRHAARLQCCWYSEYDPARLVELLSAPLRPPLGSLRPVATLDAGADPAAVIARIAASLSTTSP